MTTPIAVVVGLLVRDDGRLLLCQRSAEKSYPLEWEFPGGKVERGEAPEDALARELREELDIEARVGKLLHEKVSHYADGGTFAVAYYRIDAWSGTMRNVVFADLHWVLLSELPTYQILSGNREFCERLAAAGVEGFMIERS